MVEVECVMHGALEDYLPEARDGNRIRLNFDRRPSVNDILERLQLDPDELQFVLADGRYIEWQQWSEPTRGDLLQFWPRISGG